MKFISYILMISIILLTTSSGWASENNCHPKKKSCCSIEHTKNNQEIPNKENGKNCCKDLCNPFMTCCGCHAMVSESESLSETLDFKEKEFSLMEEKFYSDFSKKNWHPPKSI